MRELEQKRKADVADPTASAVRRTDKLADRLANLADRFVQSAPAERPGADGPAELAKWAAAVEKSCAASSKKLTEQAKEKRARAAEQRSQAEKLLAGASLATTGRLDEAIVEAATDLREAAKEENEARAQVPVVAELERRLEAGGAFLSDLRAVYDLLADSRFIKFLMRRRQQALLAVATTLLDEMSSGRFGFSQDFAVVDRYTGQPRSTSTLSGGESFLASMALALAMVELAGRAGGRLDSLFLDEGFGALDAQTLDVAIDALEGRAVSGRLVAVISHVKAVAERIEDVLAVSYTPTAGSSFRMLTPGERTGLVEDDASLVVAGLLV